MTGSDLSRRRIPLMAAETGIPGPVVWLTACSHGDEVGGIVIIQEIFKALRQHNDLIKGSLYAFPLMNPLGFETQSRHISFSKEDLNRSFPGDPEGSLGERIANLIFNTIIQTSPALVVDLHNDWIRSIPYALIDADPGSEYNQTYEKTKNFAKQTGLLMIKDNELLSNSLSYSLHMRHVPSLTLELGESFVINEKNIICGVRSVENLLVYLGMKAQINRPFKYAMPDAIYGKILLYSARPFSSTSGIIRFIAKPGDIVKKDKAFARVYNIFGKLKETMKAANEGIVLGHTDSSVTFPGMPVMAFGMI